MRPRWSRLAGKAIMSAKAISYLSDRRRFQLLTLVLATSVLLLALGTGRAHAVPSCAVPAVDIVSPSCFEGGDGNLTTDHPLLSHIDWDTLVGLNPPATQYQDPRDPVDDVFNASAADEQTPSGWSFDHTPPSSAPSKADILNTVFYTETAPNTPSQIFLYAGFENDAGGNVNVSFELNKGNPAGGLFFNNTHDNVPYRSDNDVLVTYDGTVGNVRIGLCYWHGDDPAHPNLAGNWYDKPTTELGPYVPLGGSVKQCGQLPAMTAIGGINAVDMPNSTLSSFSQPTILLGNF